MWYNNKHWISLDGVDVIAFDWAFFCLWYSKRMVERQVSLCKLSCFGLVNNLTHYEVYHWTKEHIARQDFMMEMIKEKEKFNVISRKWEVATMCKTVVSWGRQYCDEIKEWTKQHHIQQIARYHRYNTEMIEFQMAVINEREHEKEHLCSYRLENLFIPKGDERCLPKVREWGRKHVNALECDYLYLVLSEAPWFYYTSLPLPSGSSDNVGDV